MIMYLKITRNFSHLIPYNPYHMFFIPAQKFKYPHLKKEGSLTDIPCKFLRFCSKVCKYISYPFNLCIEFLPCKFLRFCSKVCKYMYIYMCILLIYALNKVYLPTHSNAEKSLLCLRNLV